MLRHRAPLRIRRRRTAAFTLVETSVSIAVLVLGVLGMVASVTAGDRLILENRQTRQAYVAAQTMFAELQAEPIDTVFQRYNATASDDPVGAGQSPGASFTARGLLSSTSTSVEGTGAIRFPTRDGVTLREGMDDPALGMPRDLDGDGVISHTPLTKAPLILPVLVTIRWETSHGPREVQVRKFLFGGG